MNEIMQQQPAAGAHAAYIISEPLLVPQGVEQQPKTTTISPARFSMDLAFDFRQYLAGSVSDVTADGYFVCLRNFAEWLDYSNVSQPTRNDIINYARYLATPHRSPRRGAVITFSATTQARYLRAVKAFFRWADNRGFYKYPCDDVRGAKVRIDIHRRDALSADEARQLVSKLKSDTERDKRNRAMVLLTMNAGLRIIELQRADIGDLEMKAGQAWIRVQGKGHTEKDFRKKIDKRVYTAIQDYLKARSNRDAQAPLFVGTGRRANGLRMTEPATSAIIKSVMRDAGFDSPRLTAHSLRHTFVTLDLETGASLQEACNDVGHSSVAVTQIYAHNIDKEQSTAAARVAAVMFNDSNSGAGKDTAQANFFASLTLDEQSYYVEFIRQQRRFMSKDAAQI